MRAREQLLLPMNAKATTLSARFLVARRSVLQLFYEDASVWLNPQDNRPAPRWELCAHPLSPAILPGGINNKHRQRKQNERTK